MKTKKLNTNNKLDTPGSETTLYIDYSPKNRILEIAFTGGATYHYFSVGPEIWQRYRNVISSGLSSGKFVNEQIKPHFPDFKKLY